jgi:glycosyltransferase involved in cell wall biosynthesis
LLALTLYVNIDRQVRKPVLICVHVASEVKRMIPKLDTCSIVVPVYNSEQSLPLLVSELAHILPAFSNIYEVILVNDGSRDRSWEIINELTKKYNWLQGINLMRNYGQHNALLCGIRRVKYDVIITLDDDLQNPPSEIPKLVQKLAEGYDVVYGTPQGGHKQGLWRLIASQVTRLVLRSSMSAEIAQSISPFRAMRTYVRRAFMNYDSPYVSIDVLLTWATTRFATVPVQHDERRFGRSTYTLRKLIIHALNLLTGFTIWPLQLASLIGFLFTLFGIFTFFYVMSRYLIEGTSVPGFPFIASVITIFSGVQLFALGVIGEYLSRMHMRSMGRPSWVVREVAGTGIISKDILEESEEVILH